MPMRNPTGMPMQDAKMIAIAEILSEVNVIMRTSLSIVVINAKAFCKPCHKYSIFS
jgi:hypothetical protein